MDRFGSNPRRRLAMRLLLGTVLTGSAGLFALPVIEFGTAAPAGAVTPSPLCSSVSYSGPDIVVTCSFTGGAQYVEVPPGVTSVTVNAYGAQGGTSEADYPGTSPGEAEGAEGGYTEATVAVTPGEVLQVNVGGAGGNAMALAKPHSATEKPGSAGWNGGECGSGAAAFGTIITGAPNAADGGLDGPSCAGLAKVSGPGTPVASVAAASGGSGGASDVRAGGTSTADRIVVAGGGAAAGACATQTGKSRSFTIEGGGAGGGSTGGTGAGSPLSEAGLGGTQVAGGVGGSPGGNSSTSDEGGLASGNSYVDDVSGAAAVGGPGGAGFWGGGGGGSSAGSKGCTSGSGGGGSSYPPTATVLEQGVHTGNGLVTITYLGATADLSTHAVTTGTGGSGVDTVTFFGLLTSDGQPLAGQPVTFSAGAFGSCTAITNANGSATCVVHMPNTVTAGFPPYEALYGGSAVYLPTEAEGTIFPAPPIAL